MKRAILSAAKWDSQIAQFVREYQPFNQSNSLTKEMKDLFTFLRDFFEAAVGVEGSTLSYQNFPHVMQVIQKYSESDNQVA